MSSKKPNTTSKKTYRTYSALVSTTPSFIPSESVPVQTSAPITTTPTTSTSTSSATTTAPGVTSIFTSTSGTDPSSGLNYPPLRYISSSESLAPRSSVTFDYTSSNGFAPPSNFGVGAQYSQERIFGPTTGETVDYTTTSTIGSHNVSKPNNQFEKPNEFQSISGSGLLSSSIFGQKRCNVNNNLPPPPFSSQRNNSQSEQPPFNSENNPQHGAPFTFQNAQPPVYKSSQPKCSYQFQPRYAAQSNLPSSPSVTKSFGTTSGQQHASQSCHPGGSRTFNSGQAAQSNFSFAPNSTRTFGNLFNQQSTSRHGTQLNIAYTFRGRGIENQPPQKSAHSQILKSSTYFASKNRNTTKCASYANTGPKTNSALRPKTNITYSQAAKQSTHAPQKNTSSVLFSSSGTRQTTETSTLPTRGYDSQNNRLPESYSNFSFFTTTPTTILTGGHSSEQNPLFGLNTNVSFSQLNKPITLPSNENGSQQNGINLNDIIVGQQPDNRYVPQSRPESSANENNFVYFQIPLPSQSNLQYEFGGQSQERHVPQTSSTFGAIPPDFVTQSSSTFGSNSDGVYSLNQTMIPLYPNNEFDLRSVSSTSAFQNMNASTSGFQNGNASTSGFQNVNASTSGFPNGNASTSGFQNVNTTTSGFQNGNASTSGFQNVNTTTSGFQNGNASTSGFQNGNASTSGFQNGNASTSGFQNVNTTTSGFQNGNASTSGFQNGNASTSGFQNGNASTSGFQNVNATTSGFQNGNASTSGFQNVNASTSGFPNGNASTSGFHNGNTTTSGFQNGNASTSGFQNVNTTTSGFQNGNASTSGFQNVNATTSGFQNGNASISDFQNGNASTSGFQNGNASTSDFQNVNATTSGFQNGNASTSGFQNGNASTSGFQNSNATPFNSGIGQFATQSATQFEFNPFLPTFTGLHQPGPSTSNANAGYGIDTSSGSLIGPLMQENNLFDDHFDLSRAPQLEISYNLNRNSFGYPNWSTFDSTSTGETNIALGPAVEGHPTVVPTANSDIYSIIFPCANVSPYETREIICKLAQMIKGENLLQAIKMLLRMVNQELPLPFSISCRCTTHCSYLQVVPAAYMLDYLLRAANTYRNQNVNLDYVYIEHLEVTILEDEKHFPICRMQMYTRVLPRRLPTVFI